MAIEFSIRLSMPSIELLFALVDWAEEDYDMASLRCPYCKFANFITTARVLQRNGLVAHLKEGKKGRIPMKGNHRVTRKGFAMADVLREEIKELQKSTSRLGDEQRKRVKV